jgi:uncharacterized membrane protein YeaQ/YmgE (transglycosylase-associated protein family)
MSLMSAISWCVFGLIVGAIARLLTPGRQEFGLLATIILGIVGSFLGGFLSTLIFRGSDGPVNAAGWIMSIIGAVIALYVWSRFNKS